MRDRERRRAGKAELEYTALEEKAHDLGDQKGPNYDEEASLRLHTASQPNVALVTKAEGEKDVKSYREEIVYARHLGEHIFKFFSVILAGLGVIAFHIFDGKLYGLDIASIAHDHIELLLVIPFISSILFVTIGLASFVVLLVFFVILMFSSTFTIVMLLISCFHFIFGDPGDFIWSFRWAIIGLSTSITFHLSEHMLCNYLEFRDERARKIALNKASTLTDLPN